MISIVMAYYNRLPQLVKTIQSIAAQYPLKIKEKVEVIVYDDGSIPSHNPSKHIRESKYPFDIRCVSKPRSGLNPCYAYNRAFEMVTGDKIIIQNPECVHVGPVLECVSKFLTDKNYLTFSAFALDEKNTKEYCVSDKHDAKQLSLLFNNSNGGMWYNHPKHKPTNYHFCSAITQKNLKSLGGFDERYKDGKCFDDDEFLVRVKRMGLKVNPVEWPMVIHLWHAQAEKRTNEWMNLWQRNKDLFDNVTLKEKSWKANKQSSPSPESDLIS